MKPQRIEVGRFMMADRPDVALTVTVVGPNLGFMPTCEECAGMDVGEEVHLELLVVLNTDPPVEGQLELFPIDAARLTTLMVEGVVMITQMKNLP